MSDTLIGVIFGGVIASIAPVTKLILDYRRLRTEVKLEYLKSERKRIEQLCDETLKKVPDAMANNSYPIEMLSDILILFPKRVSDKFHTWMFEKDKDEQKARSAYLDIAAEMKGWIAEIDNQIRDLVSK